MSQTATNQISVLLVDDQELFRHAIEIMVNSQPDMQVVGHATNGLEAIKETTRLQPDIVMMDIRMPDMDGVEATRRILRGERVESPGVGPRIIILTTFDFDSLTAQAIRHGASGFLLKDVSPHMLQEAIRTVHAGNSVLSPENLDNLLTGDIRMTPALPEEYDSLTEREREVLLLVGQGLSNKEIGQTLYASESTVKTHVGQILRKLNLRNRTQIVVFCFEHELRSIN